jgi:ABC-type sugar transport system substrate-binding protein
VKILSLTAALPFSKHCPELGLVHINFSRGEFVMKKILALVIVAITVLIAVGCGKKTAEGSAASGGGASKQRTIGFVVYGAANQAIAPEIKAVEDYIKARGDRCILLDAAFNFSSMPDLVEQLVVQEMDGIIVLNVFPDSIREALVKAKAADIPCVVIDCGFNDPDQSLLAGQATSDNYSAGKLVVEAYVKEFGAKGNVILMGTEGTIPAADRMRGMREVIASNPGLKILTEEESDPTDVSKAMKTVENLIQTYGGSQIDAIFCSFGNAAIGAISACQSTGYPGIKIYGIDASSDELNLVKNGMEVATIAQDFIMMGTSGIEKLYKAINKEPVGEYMTYIPVTVVNASNVDEYLAKQ